MRATACAVQECNEVHSRDFGFRRLGQRGCTMRTYAMIKAKRALDKAEAQRKLQAAREQFLLLPETEKVDLRVCQMQDLLTEISDSSLDAIVSDPPEECARFYGELAEL